MASRATLTLLPRRAPTSALVLARPFSQTALRQKSYNDSTPPPTRHNPLIGNYKPAQPSPAAGKPNRDASVSTEHPGATTTPSPDRSPVSSAEVAPNADLPPRPPPEALNAAPEKFLSPSESTQHAYDATRNQQKPAAPAKKNRGSLDILSFLSSSNASNSGQIEKLDPMSRPKVHTAAVTGRTVFVKPYVASNAAPNPPMAINVLNRLVKLQGIKGKSHYQKFHERRGLKKKRLRMERWRKQFKTGFRQTVKRVMELKRQGW